MREREFKKVSGILILAKSHVTQRQFRLCFGYFLFITAGFKNGETFANEVFCLFLIFASPASQHPATHQHFGGDVWFQALYSWPLVYARPQTSKHFPRFFIFPFVLEVFSQLTA